MKIYRAAGKALIILSILTVVTSVKATTQYWHTNVEQTNEGTVCYVLAHPQASANSDAVDTRITAFIKMRSTSPVRTEFSTEANLDLSASDSIKLVIDKKLYKLKAVANQAWLKAADKETEVVLRMLTSKNFSIIASTKGSVTQYTYKLDGLKQALREIQSQCKSPA